MKAISLVASVLVCIVCNPTDAQPSIRRETIKATARPNHPALTLETVRSNARQVRGKYLLSMNYAPNVIDRTPPYQALMLTVSTEGAVKVLRKFSSSDVLVWGIDLKPQPDGLYSFALNRPRPPVWVYDLRLIEPDSNTEVIEPKGFPARDPDLDGHETVIYYGDRRIFLFYRTRKENDKTYIDMEVSAVSAKTGETVGRWSSRGLFPESMTGDYLHFNSLHPMSEELVLASARSTSTLYVLNLNTGKIDDQIDAASWKFINDPLNGFKRQHFAHFRDNGNLVLFDNRDDKETAPNSRAVEYQVDWKTRTLTLVWEHYASRPVSFRYGWGSALALTDVEFLIGWGDYPRTPGFCSNQRELVPVFSHVTRSKKPIFELRAPCGWVTYRVYFVPDRPKRK